MDAIEICVRGFGTQSIGNQVVAILDKSVRPVNRVPGWRSSSAVHAADRCAAGLVAYQTSVAVACVETGTDSVGSVGLPGRTTATTAAGP